MVQPNEPADDQPERPSFPPGEVTAAIESLRRRENTDESIAKIVAFIKRRPIGLARMWLSLVGVGHRKVGASDVAQDMFLKLLEKLHDGCDVVPDWVTNRNDLAKYLLSCTKGVANDAAKHYRAKKRWDVGESALPRDDDGQLRGIGEFAPDPADHPSNDCEAHSNSELQILFTLIEELDPEECRLWELVAGNEGVEGAAELLGITEDEVWSRMRTVRAKASSVRAKADREKEKLELFAAFAFLSPAEEHLKLKPEESKLVELWAMYGTEGAAQHLECSRRTVQQDMARIRKRAEKIRRAV
jgi:DNA-directed RNA polymerase specialized sigma24 family protein